MKLPICLFDAKVGILCPKCEVKLKGGHITKADVDASIKLVKLAGKYPELNRITLLRALNVNSDLVLILGAGNLAFIRKDPTLQKKLEEELGEKLWFLEGESTDRVMLEDLFYPIRILTVNVVWLPDGSKLTKVIIPGRKTKKFPIDIEKVIKIAKEVRGIELLVEFEKG
ncbi:MAG: transcription elongation factor NusA [Nitrososphaerota archaeon]|nr:transcription elongation factor NusA [Nitrososphaerota archaeon]